MLREGNRVAILGYGTIVQSCVRAAEHLHVLGISSTVADARFCKPLDGELIRQLAQEHEVLITVEEGSIGGFSSHVSHFLSLNGILDGKLKVEKRNRYKHDTTMTLVDYNVITVKNFSFVSKAVLLVAVEAYDTT